MQGSVEAEFLFATLLSDDMLPFGWRHLSLVVLPLKDGELLDADDATRKGKTGLADWLRKAEREWKLRAKTSERIRSIYERLDYDGNLTAQSPTGVYKLLYNTSGTHLCACVVDAKDVSHWQVDDLPVQGFVADTKTYWLETKSEGEAHYLCAVLNAPCVDEFIKPFQSKGAFGAQSGRGERDIHRRPFEVLPIPLFNPRDGRHLKLAELSKECHEKVAQFVANADERTLRQLIGRLRQQVREMLSDDLSQINQLVAELVGLPLMPPIGSNPDR